MSDILGWLDIPGSDLTADLMPALKNPSHYAAILFLFLVLVFGSGAASSTATAAVVAGSDTMVTGASATEILYVTATMGYTFTVGDTDLLATGLGVFDYEGDGLDAVMQAGLWGPGNELLGDLSFSGTNETLANTQAYNDAMGSGFRYALFDTPVLLSANTTYIVGARTTENISNGVYYDASGLTFHEGIAYGVARWSPAESELALPTGTMPYGDMVTVDVLLSQVPEPRTSLLLLLAGCLALQNRCRDKRGSTLETARH